MNGYVLENKLGISNAIDLKLNEERITKLKVIELWEESILNKLDIKPDSFEMYKYIHEYLFSDIYDFAGRIRDVNIAKGNFTFVPVRFINNSIMWINELPTDTIEQIIDKYTEFNILHPFREGNGRSLRIWLDNLLKVKFGKIIEWNNIDKNIYFEAMVNSTVDNSMLKKLIIENLIDYNKDNIAYFKGVDRSYEYEEMNSISALEIYKENKKKIGNLYEQK